MTPILPGATIGFLGGGQLGRMTAFAARSMGYDIQVLDPDPNCAARAVASRTITAPFNDVAAAVELAKACDVITLEIEQISPEALDAAAEFAPVRPGRAPVYIIQDRLRQKKWLRQNHFPVGDFREARSGKDISDAVTAMGASIAKSCHGGYDGRGQVRIKSSADGDKTWDALGGRQCIVEQHLDIALELSVLVARRPGGETIVYPASRNHHTHGVLTWAVIPAELPATVLAEAAALAPAIATRLGIVGLLAVEFFYTRDGRLLVNELAPRPHNTYHHSERACNASQFEQLVRAVCDLPFGGTDILAPSAMINLLGEVWLQSEPPQTVHALEVAASGLHLYGKPSAREGRKMGHITTTGATPSQALERVLEAYTRLSPGTAPALELHHAVPMLDEFRP
ncbi:MAG: 5-(carboxyamino)imidazole ribonucleotide synthase [Gemmatimonas sp.]